MGSKKYMTIPWNQVGSFTTLWPLAYHLDEDSTRLHEVTNFVTWDMFENMEFVLGALFCRMCMPWNMLALLSPVLHCMLCRWINVKIPNPPPCGLADIINRCPTRGRVSSFWRMMWLVDWLCIHNNNNSCIGFEGEGDRKLGLWQGYSGTFFPTAPSLSQLHDHLKCPPSACALLVRNLLRLQRLVNCRSKSRSGLTFY